MNTTNHSGLRRGGPGRPKGAKNKITLERDAFSEWAEYFNSERYAKNAKARIEAGRAPHLEGYWLPRIFGREPQEITGNLVVKWQQ